MTVCVYKTIGPRVLVRISVQKDPDSSDAIDVVVKAYGVESRGKIIAKTSSYIVWERLDEDRKQEVQELTPGILKLIPGLIEKASKFPEHKVRVAFGEKDAKLALKDPIPFEEMDIKVYSFYTPEEADAFKRGIREALGFTDGHIFSEEGLVKSGWKTLY